LRKIAGLLTIVALSALVPGAALAAPSSEVALNGTVSGATLAIHFRTAPLARCSFVLGSGGNAIKVARGTAGPRGRGVVSYKLASDTAAGRRPLSAICSHSGQRLRGKGFVTVPSNLSSGNGALATALNVLLDLLLGGSLLLFGYLLIQMVVKASDPREKLMRSLALIGGAVIALGAQASGVSFASFTIDTLTGARPGGEAFKAVAVIVPGGVAAFFGWYFVRVMRRSADMGLRLMSFLGMLTVVAFAVIFAQATNTKGVILGAAAIPNASFVAGLIFGVVVFTPTADAEQAGGRFQGLKDTIRRRAPKSAQPFVGAAGDEQATAVATHNPFADE
jgi:hypothetical protein